MKKIFFGSFLLISMLSPLIVSAKTVEHIIYQYAELIDTRKFDELQTIMWEDFKMTGGYEINSLSEFLGAMQQLASTYDSTCLLYTSPSPRDLSTSRMPSSA